MWVVGISPETTNIHLLSADRILDRIRTVHGERLSLNHFRHGKSEFQLLEESLFVVGESSVLEVDVEPSEVGVVDIHHVKITPDAELVTCCLQEFEVLPHRHAPIPAEVKNLILFLI